MPILSKRNRGNLVKKVANSAKEQHSPVRKAKKITTARSKNAGQEEKERETENEKAEEPHTRLGKVMEGKEKASGSRQHGKPKPDEEKRREEKASGSAEDKDAGPSTRTMSKPVDMDKNNSRNEDESRPQISKKPQKMKQNLKKSARKGKKGGGEQEKSENDKNVSAKMSKSQSKKGATREKNSADNSEDSESEEQKQKREEEEKALLIKQIQTERTLIKKLQDTIDIKKFELVQQGPKAKCYTARDVMNNLLPDYSHIKGFRSHENSMTILTEEINFASQVTGVELVELESQINDKAEKPTMVAKFKLLAEEDTVSLEFSMTFTSSTKNQNWDDIEVEKFELLNGDVSDAAQHCFDFCLKNKDVSLAVELLKQYQQAADQRLNVCLELRDDFQDFLDIKLRKNVNIITLIIGEDKKTPLIKMLWGFQFKRKGFRYDIEMVYRDKETENLITKECGELVDQLETASKYSKQFEKTLVQFLKQLKNLKRRNSAVV